MKWLLLQNKMALWQLSQEEGIFEAKLNEWRAEARDKVKILPYCDAGPEGMPSSEKFAAMLKSSILNEFELAGYCHNRGLCWVRISAWRSKDSVADVGVYHSGANGINFCAI